MEVDKGSGQLPGSGRGHSGVNLKGPFPDSPCDHPYGVSRGGWWSSGVERANTLRLWMAVRAP